MPDGGCIMGLFTNTAKAHREEGGEAVASLTVTDEAGEKVRYRIGTHVTGDVRNPAAWADAIGSAGEVQVTTSSNVAGIDVKNAGKRSLKDVRGSTAATELRAFLGLTAGKPHRKRSGGPDSIDTATGEPALNGQSS